MDEKIRLSRQQEKRIASKLDGQVSKGSGNGWVKKNDVRTAGVLWEMKRTGKTQITIKLVDLEQLRKEACLEGRMPVFHIEIGKRRAVILLEDDYLALVD